MTFYLFQAFCFISLLLSVSKAQQGEPDAEVRLVSSGPDYPVRGSLQIWQCEDGIRTKGTVEGLSPGLHGFHVHQHPDLGNGCVAAGSHFNPFGRFHGGPRSEERHVGDFGNIFANSLGVAEIDYFDRLASLDIHSEAYIGDRSIVIHAGQDDLGKGGNEGSRTTGNAGGRVACGLIHMTNKRSGQFPQQTIIDQPKLCKPKYASSLIVNGNSEILVDGQLSFVQEDKDADVIIQGTISGLKPGLHGFHIHANGDLGNACANAGGHFNPFSKNHGHPQDAARHVGDLGNIHADESGRATIHIRDSHSSLQKDSKAYIGGLAVVVHALPDDLGRGRNEESLRTGNAGGRVGCGLIVAEEDKLDSGFESSSNGGALFTPISLEPVGTAKQGIEDSNAFYNPAIEHHNFNPSLSDLKEAITAYVQLIPSHQNQVSGELKISERGSGVFVEGRISGLSPGLHGFHVHALEGTGNNCIDAGGHFNPFQKNHGHPNSLIRHVGDWGNIEADSNGVAIVAIYDTHASLHPNSLANIGQRTIVVHRDPDDLGRGRNAESLKTGNAGARQACGIIQVDPSSQATPPNALRQENLQPAHHIRPAIADVELVSGSLPGVSGFLIVKESGNGVFIEGIVSGLPPGQQHGFHIHEKGQLTNKCVDAGGHFNPYSKNHGSPRSSVRHVGDLGNIISGSDGVARINLHDGIPSLDPHSEAFIGGRTFVIHAGPDDLGKGRNAESLKTGNAGSRIACGFIRIRSFEAHQALSPDDGFYHSSFGTIFPLLSAPDASVQLIQATEEDRVRGDIHFRKQLNGVAIIGLIKGLSPGSHGFHIHEVGDTGAACVNAGGHFNPLGAQHGSPLSRPRHIGDLGNIVADSDGRATINIYDSLITLLPDAREFIGDRTLVIHEMADDLGRGPNQESLKTGNAGRRVACGIVKVNPNILAHDASQKIHFPI